MNLHEQCKFHPHAENELIIKFKEGTPQEIKDALHKKTRSSVIESSHELGFHRITSHQTMRSMLKQYSESEHIEIAEPNHVYKAFYTPNDPYFANYQYGPQRVLAPSAWNITQSSSTIKIAVVDTGVQPNHPELAGKLLPGYNYVDGNTNTADGNGHGTHVAGIAAASTNNGVGIAGMAPLASIIPIRSLDNNGSGLTSSVANGIVYAANNGANVVNLSLGSPANDSFLQAAVQYAWDRGAVVIAAAGNDNSSTPVYPAFLSGVVSVASTNASDVKSSFSNYGYWVDVAAPGDQILSTYLTSSYAYLSGTSMSTPHVSGLAALLASQGRTNTNVRDCIMYTCDAIPGTGTYWTQGRINALLAVQQPV
ncbi:thermitase [Paenibacillus shirakamiensis]|uniref:Thermitase n=1 Tax=Paenibacillus shirakamiensis TaxID=1265935 RepID=A0ABS4JE82_9BACL|nr:S8 family peptidase [Paenibacillus shirakamiensis]MBP2000030.1 thermitase [Paenibacillus shirakamiensis]